MLSKKIYIPFILIAAASVLAAVFIHRSYSFYLIPSIIILAVVFVLSPQIDWWWYQKHPPELSGAMSAVLMKYFPFYTNLSASNKRRFRARTRMYKEARGFFGKLGGDDDKEVPEDIKTIISANVVMMTFGKKDFILDPFERVILYLQAFPSPQFPKHLHASEIFEEDSCVIFSAEHVNLSFRSPGKYYNLVLHEFAKVFRINYPQYDYPVFDEKIWEGFSKESISRFIGLPDIDAFPVSVVFFFAYPEKFKNAMPEIFQKYQDIFNLNPMNQEDPIVDHLVVSKVV